MVFGKKEATTKKAQSTGTGAAVLILLIAALIIIYILFLPPQARQEILQEQGTGQIGSGAGFKELLIESPGKIEVLQSGSVEHNLPAVNLFSTTQAVVIKTISSVYTKHGWLDSQSANVTFALENVASTDNVLLSFALRTTRGRLIIKLNGYEIFNSEPRPTMEPVRIPHELLKESNLLTFEASEVGFKFWTTNEHELENLKLTAEVTDVTTQEAKTVFHVTTTEKDNINRVFLKFIPECTQDKIGVLDVFLNNHNVFSAVPDCGVLRSIELAPEYLISGENALLFKTAKGVYVIDLIQVKAQLKEISYPSYYFDIKPEVYDAIVHGGVVELTLEFSNDVDRKYADLFVNGHAQSIATTANKAVLPITPFVAPGNNVVEIRPRTTLDVANLRVVAR
ncbi:MAG: hypothetical protein Q7R76_05170 [Candidatus Woesearchaeota archaeon]|nr:hypothetical protein [Candidatus Woesearchaeota archaeon]